MRLAFFAVLLLPFLSAAAGDSAQNPIWLSPGQQVSGLSDGSDVYYAFNTTQSVIYTVTLMPLDRDLDLRIDDQTGMQVDFSARGGLANDTVVFHAPATNITYAVVYGGQGGRFTLKVERGGPEPCSIYSSCSACASQTGCGWCSNLGRCVAGSYLGPSGQACAPVFWVWLEQSCAGAPHPSGTPANSSFENATEIGDTFNGTIPLASTVFYKYLTTAGIYRITLQPHDGDLDLAVFDNNEEYIAGSSNGGTSPEVIDADSQGFLYMRVNSLDGTNFTLTIQKTNQTSPTPVPSASHSASPTTSTTQSPTPSPSASPSPVSTCPLGLLLAFAALILFAAKPKSS